MKEDYQKLLEDGKSYLKLRYDLLRLELLDKLSLILGLLVLIIVALFILLAAMAYFSVALVGWMANSMPVSLACCILGGVLLVILPVVYLLRYHLFINPFIKLFSRKLFSPKEDDVMNYENDEKIA